MSEYKIQVGQKYKKPNDKRLYHVCAIVDNGEAVVLKFYGLHKQYWHYEVERIFSFRFAIQIGLYTLRK